MKTKYAEKHYVLVDNVAIKVKAKTYDKDKRLFIYRGDSGYELVDKQTGLRVLVAKTLEKVNKKYSEYIGLYNKVVKGRFYNHFKSVLGNILRYGTILIKE